MKMLKQVEKEKNPKKKDEVIIEYTGNLYDELNGASNNFRGTP